VDGINKVVIGNGADNSRELILQPEGGSVSTLVLAEGLRGGMRVIEVDNGRLKFWLLPERGMGIWKIWVDGIEFGWQSPVRGPVHPSYVTIHESNGLGWLDGFDELLCRCGLESNGAPEFSENGQLKYPLHGKIANLPAHYLAAEFNPESHEILVKGEVDEARFHHQRLALASTVSTEIGGKSLCIRDTVSNYSARSAQFQLLYHINFGLPLLGAGATVLAPIKNLVPRTAEAAEAIDEWSVMRAPTVEFSEQVYFMELLGDESGSSQVMLKNAAGTLGVSIHFNLSQLPYFTLWKNTAAVADGYVAGLEPGTNFPNPRSFEEKQGRVETLMAGESKDFEVHLTFHLDADDVQQAEAAIAKLQASHQPSISRSLQKEWSIEAVTLN
jgi:hypothetical protein